MSEDLDKTTYSSAAHKPFTTKDLEKAIEILERKKVMDKETHDDCIKIIALLADKAGYKMLKTPYQTKGFLCVPKNKSL